MAKSFKILREAMSDASKSRVEELHSKLQQSLPLASLRSELGFTQAAVAEKLEVSQAAISKLEGRNDLLLSTLDKYVSATGGRWVLNIVYPDRAFKIALGAYGAMELQTNHLQPVNTKWSEPTALRSKSQVRKADLMMEPSRMKLEREAA